MSDDVRTEVTLIEGDRLFYRGHDAADLAANSTFEAVCALLWQSDRPRFVVDPAVTRAFAASLRRASRVAAVRASGFDRLRLAMALAAVHAPIRGDLSHAGVVRAASHAIGACTYALAGGSAAAADPGSPRLADVLRQALNPAAPRRPIEQAMILAADHDLAGSTTAGRVAASVRVDLPAVLSAALSAADSPLHGRASAGALQWLRMAVESPHDALTGALAQLNPPPGFGHTVYVDADPRGDFLLDRLRRSMPASVRTAVDLVTRELLVQRGWPATIDFGLACMTVVHDLPAHAGELIFGVSRMAGWTAHAIEEYACDPLRFRLRGVYAGDWPDL